MQASLKISSPRTRVAIPGAHHTTGDTPVTLLIPATRVALCLGASVAVLLALHLLGAVATFFFDRPTLFGIVPRFTFNSEANIPAWYAATMLFVCSVLFAGISYLRRSLGERYVRHWIGLAIIFLYMSADEGGQLHELLTEPSERALGNAGGWLHFAWIAPAIVVVAIVARAYLGFLLHLPGAYARLFVLSAALFLGGAIGMELIGGWYLSNHADNFQYALLTGLEETLEKAGVVLLIFTQLKYLAQTSPGIKLLVRNDA